MRSMVLLHRVDERSVRDGPRRRVGRARRRPGVLALGVLALGVLALGLGWPMAARANPVNAEKLLNDPEDGGWGGSLSTKFALSVGNVDRMNIGFDGGIQYWTLYPEGAGLRPGINPVGLRRFFRDRWVLITNAAFLRVGSDDVVNNGFAHTRYTRMWRPRVGSEVFVQSQYNEFKLLQQRTLGGLGIRVDPVNRQVIQLWAGSGYMNEYERYTFDPALDPHPVRVVNHRWTSYGVIQLRLWESELVARNTTYFQPRFDDFTDFRLLESLQLEIRAGPVALGAELEVQYDNDPPRASGVVPLDVFVSNYVRVGSS